MRHQIFILLVVALPFLHGQESRGSARPALDPGDIRNFLNQSQIVEFKPTLKRDPFRLPSPGQSKPLGKESIDDLIIFGRVVFDKKAYALAWDANRNVLRCPVGYQFVDGVITAITDREVVFSQWDPSLGNQSIRRTIRKVFKMED